MSYQKTLTTEEPDIWLALEERWRRERASAPTRRDLCLAMQERPASESRATETVASPAVAEKVKSEK